MASDQVKRKLAAILAADITGYSRLMGADEAGTLAGLKEHRRALIDPKSKQYRGRVVKTTGDGILIEFPSVVDAVGCAIDVQKGMRERNADVPPENRIEFRIGINLGDVIIDGRDLYGDGVNIAARLEGLAEPGGICISQTVFNHARGKVAFDVEDMGEQPLKNIVQPVHVYRILLHAAGKSGISRTPERVRPALPSRPSIAVLPFTSIGAAEESGYFAEGVADDIITELSRDRDLFVVARHSSFHVAQESRDPATVGRLLGVRYLLTGSVRRAGERVRLSLHLIECETGGEAWAERYDRRLEDVFDVQLDVARTVTSTIAGRLTALASEAIAAKAPDNFAAYDHVLRAQQFLQHYTRSDYAHAREHLEAAIRADPSYARPYSLLCLAAGYDWFWQASDDSLANVLAIGEKALSLDEHDPKAHLALGCAHLWMRHHDRAVHHIERAMALNPNDDLIAVEHGRLLMYLDRAEEGLLRVREAMRLNPYHPNWYWNIEGRCLHTLGRYEEAIAAFERVDAPQFWVEAYFAACHAMCGRPQRAAYHLDRLRATRPDFRLNDFRRGLPYRWETSLQRFLETFRRAGIED
jgi:adenylate cyclase